MFQIGLVADIQYASKPGNPMMNSSLTRLQEAVQYWDQKGVSFVINLGDTIDGGRDEQESKDDMIKVVNCFSKDTTIEHVIGNHCLKRNKREVVRHLLGIQSDYRVVDLPHDWKLIVLDTTELSVCGGGFPEGTYQHCETMEFLKDNPTVETYNGGVTSKQLKWFRDVLLDLSSRSVDGKLIHHKKVIVAAHHPVGPIVPTHQAWNAADIRSVMNDFPSLVHTVFSGHYHEGGYVLLNGVHYLTLSSLMSCDDNSFAVMEISDLTIKINGCDTEQHNYTLKPKPETLPRSDNFVC
eukprot:TRINITY_DN20220_c0_g1_i1.p1 TRINITY_DN20220_c0_g1~~TRINITY_DN20220_c0_g1_i1.p1  ORF type:complete len:295 (+),score=52.28 TRINITY_DN20220_c0_g1_i1:66-950(+)